MKGLLYKDLSTVWNAYKKNLLLVVVLYSFLSYSTDTEFFAYFLVFLLGMYACTSMSFDEACHWDVYARTLPVTPARQVASKYVTGLIWIGLGVALSLAISLVVGLVRGDLLSETMPKIAAGCGGVLIVTVLYNALTLPFSYKFGSAKARNYILLSYLGVFLLLFGIGTRMLPDVWKENLSEMIARIEFPQAALALGVAVALVFALYIASWAVSTAIYRRKEY